MIRRIIRASSWTLLALVLVVGGFAGWLYATGSGARFLLARAEAASGGRLTVGAVSGSLRDSLVLDSIAFRGDGVAVGIDELAIQLGLAAMLSGSIDVEQLRSSTIRVQLTSPAAPAPSAAPPTLPLGLAIRRASIEGVALTLADGRGVELERMTVAGLAHQTTLELQRFETRWQGFFLSWQGSLAWADGLVLDGVASASGELGGRELQGSAELVGRWPEIQVEQQLLEPFAESARGSLRLGATPSFDLDLNLAGIGELSARGSLDSAERLVSARISGTDLTPAGVVPDWPGQLDLDGDFTLAFAEGLRLSSENLNAVARLGDQSLSVAAAGRFDSAAGLGLDRLDARLGANRVAVSGTAGQALALDVTADLGDLAELARLAAREEIQALDASTALDASAALATSLSGAASAALRITGTLAMPQVAGNVRLTGSRFADLPLELAVDFATPAANEASIRIERLESSLGASRLSGSGTIGATALEGAADAPLALTLEARAGDLAELAAVAARDDVATLIGRRLPLTGLSGAAKASLDLGGTLAAPELRLDLSATKPGFGGRSVAAATLDAELGLFDGASVDVRATLDDPGFSAALGAAGRLDGGRFSGRLLKLDLDEHELGIWSLTMPVPLVVGPGVVDLDRVCLSREGSDICGEWSHGAEERLRLEARDFDLALLDPVLPPTITLTGRIGIDARLDAPDGKAAGTASASGGGIGIDIAMSETDRVTTTLTSVSLDATLAGSALSLEAVVDSENQGHAELSMSSDDVRSRTAPIGGRLQIVWPDLALLSLVSPDIGEVGGGLELAIDVTGTAEDPALSGTATVTGGHVSVPALGLLVDRITGEATSLDGSTLEYRGEGYVEDSAVRLTGVTELDPDAGWPTTLKLAGDNVPVAHRPDATIYASPDFDVAIHLPRIDVTGRVLVPKADISVEKLPAQAVRVSPDAVVHGRVESESIRPIEVSAMVTVDLGDDVHYSGSNLSTELGGSLELEYHSGQSPIASGNVRLAGSYDAYGQTLDLERGELLFAGPLTDPALDVLAVRRIPARPGNPTETTVGIRLTGTLLEPEASLYSDPAMSDLNALSYLRFGRPLTSSDDTETATLESTALALGLQQALPAVQRVGESLGLDELTIATNDVDAGALMAGKYLSPKVYMSYSYGLFNRLGGFLLRYQINDRFSLETRSGNEKSMDLLYSIEKE